MDQFPVVSVPDVFHIGYRFYHVVVVAAAVITVRWYLWYNDLFRSKIKVMCFSNAASGSLRITSINQAGIVFTEVALELGALGIEDPRSKQHDVLKFHIET
jgi:hypothetical protein